jgi:hypothetical protein
VQQPPGQLQLHLVSHSLVVHLVVAHVAATEVLLIPKHANERTNTESFMLRERIIVLFLFD